MAMYLHVHTEGLILCNISTLKAFMLSNMSTLINFYGNILTLKYFI